MVDYFLKYNCPEGLMYRPEVIASHEFGTESLSLHISLQGASPTALRLNLIGRVDPHSDPSPKPIIQSGIKTVANLNARRGAAQDS